MLRGSCNLLEATAAPVARCGARTGAFVGRRARLRRFRGHETRTTTGSAVMATIYVETSIPSFYYEVRAEPEMVARRQWTREWWQTARTRFELVTPLELLAEGNDET